MSLKDIFRRKSFDALKKEVSSSKGLVRSFGAFQLILLGVGAIVGGGIFVFIGPAAYHHAGPAITLSFALSGFVCICAGLCYAEFASVVPASGSSYTYAYAVLGEFPAWLIGCSMIMTYFLAAASVANGWSSYFVGLLAHYGIHLPAKFVHTTGYEIVGVNGGIEQAIFDIPAFCISILTMLVLYRGTKESSMVNNIVVFIKIAILVAFILIGFTKIDLSNWTPFIPENTGKFGEYGLSGVIAGISIVFLAFNGFDSVCTAAQETKNPQKNLPIGIIGATLFSTIVYIFVGAVLTGVVSYKDLNTSEPIAVAVDRMGIPAFITLVKLGALAAITSVILVNQYVVIRMIYAIAGDGLLPSVFKKIHKKYHTPHLTTLFIGLPLGIVAASCVLETILKLSTFLVLLTIMTICFGTIYMRYKYPNLERGFKCPFVPWIPLVAILLVVQILFGYPCSTVFGATVCLVIFTVYYLLYGQYKSKLYQSPKIS